MADNLVEAMQPQLRDRFMQLKGDNATYRYCWEIMIVHFVHYIITRVRLEAMNQELDSYNSRKTSLEDELAVSQVKREAVVLYEQLAEAEAKRDKLLEEARQRGTPAQERERLLAQVRTLRCVRGSMRLLPCFR